MGMEFGIIGVGVVLDAFLAFYLILGSIGIGYFFLRTGFKKSDSIHKEYRIGWSIVFGLSYSFAVIIFSLGAAFFGIGGMGFGEFLFIFSGLVFAAGIGLLKARSMVLPLPSIAQRHYEGTKMEKPGKREHKQILEFDNPKETRLRAPEAGKTVEMQSRTMIDFLELSKKEPENAYTKQPPAKPVMEKPVPPVEEKKTLQAKESQSLGKFAIDKKPVEKKEPFHPFGIFKKDLQKQARENASAPEAKIPEKPVQPAPLVAQQLLPMPKKTDLKSIIPEKRKTPITVQSPLPVQKQAPPVERKSQEPPKETLAGKKKEYSPLPQDKLDYFGLSEKSETLEEKPVTGEQIPENETPLQRLLREKREKIMKLKKKKG